MASCSGKVSAFTASEFVEYLVNSTSSTHKKNLTLFSQEIKDLLKKTSNCGSLLSTKDNLERIKKFKNVWYNDLKQSLEKTLLKVPPKLTSSETGEESHIDLLMKSETISTLLRNKGNEYYKKKDVERALRCYTLACAYAPKGSSFEALAYSNRSACFLETNDLQQCLQDIERFESIWTEKDDIKVRERLAERKRKCLNKISSNGESQNEMDKDLEFYANEYFKLKRPSKTVTSAEEFIGIRDDPLKGRHVANIGESPILPGTVVILEKPYAHILLKTFSFAAKHCSACLKDLNGGGIPCEQCVFVLYCSNECASSPYQKRHSSYECKISPYLYELNMNRTIYLSLSILLILGPAGFLDHVRSYTTDSINESQTQIIGFSSTGIYDSSSYSTLYNLIYHNDILSEVDIRQYCMDAVLVTEILDTETDFFSSLKLDPVETLGLKDEFSKLLLLHQMNLPCNAHSLYKLDIPRNPDREQVTTMPEEIGAGAFPLLSMINHSCDPNVVRITLKNGINAVITIQHIAPGQELVDNYGSHYALEGRIARQSHLHSMYNFNCNCPACKNNWPEIAELCGQSESAKIRICPKCRLELDAGNNDGFAKIILHKESNNSDQSKTALLCNKCSWNTTEKEWIEKFKEFEEKYGVAVNSMFENKPTEAFSSALECLKFFDGRFLKPFKFVNLSQEVMKQALNLVVKKILD